MVAPYRYTRSMPRKIHTSLPSIIPEHMFLIKYDSRVLSYVKRKGIALLQILNLQERVCRGFVSCTFPIGKDMVVTFFRTIYDNWQQAAETKWV
jgi:hypothetical protein